MRKFVMSLALLASAATAAAQSAAMKPFEINMDRVKVASFGGNFASSKTYLIPTVNLVVSARGSVWAKSGGAKAHGKYYVDGLSKPMLQELASKIQNDLVTRMRAAGYTVLTYEDVKGEPDVASHGRDKLDDRYGLPTTGGLGMPVTFVVATPTDAQAFDSPVQGPAWWLRGIAKAKDLIVIVPEIKFTVPQMFGETESGYARDSAGIATDPAMVFEGAAIYGMNAKGGTPSIQVQRHGKRLAAEVTGMIRKVSEDKTTFSSTWETTSGDFVMTLDPVAFSDGILRVGYAVNALIVSETAKGRH
ncbi:MAG: hypothetical protein QOC81_236 [Thermoanaerobaculia bacterium]|jgi:hypothetical protein|nr:hypothetical protein [Thermoanaerobaculia bacterium]